jgi:hypothetical protein
MYKVIRAGQQGFPVPFDVNALFHGEEPKFPERPVADRPAIAFVGTRNVDDPGIAQEALQFKQAAIDVAKRGIDVYTGAATGADTMAAQAALEVGGRVKFFLPKEGYNQEFVGAMQRQHSDRVSTQVYNPKENAAWSLSVDVLHPAPGNLTPEVNALMASAYGAVEGVRGVVALPRRMYESEVKDFNRSRKDPISEMGDAGGTGQALRVARMLHVPEFNFTIGEANKFRLAVENGPIDLSPCV